MPDLAELELRVKSDEVLKAEKRTEELTKAGREAEKQAGRTGRAMTGQERAAARLNKTIGRSNNLLRNFIAGAVGLAALSRATRTIAQFEESLATLRGVAISTTDSLADQERQFKQLSDTARDLGSVTRFSATEAAEGLLFLARAGFDVQQSIAAIGPTLSLAQAGMLSLGEAADFASNIVQQFGLVAEQTGEVVDTLVSTANASNTSVRQLAEAMVFAGPVAGALGQTVQETSAALGALGDSGIQASLAGTNLRGVMSSLLGPTKGVQDLLGALGITLEQIDPSARSLTDIFKEFEDANLSAGQALEIFGRRNAAGALILTASVDKMEQLTKANEDQRGISEQLARIQDDTLVGSFKGLQSAVDELFISTGDDGLAGAMRSLTDNAADVVRILADVDDGLAQGNDSARAFADALTLVLKLVTAAAFLSFGAAILTVARNATTAAAAFSGLNTVLKANPFIALISVLVGLTFAFRTLRPEITTTEERLEALGVVAIGVGDDMERLGVALNRAFESGDANRAISVLRSQIARLEAGAVTALSTFDALGNNAPVGLDEITRALGGINAQLEVASTENFDAFAAAAREAAESTLSSFDSVFASGGGIAGIASDLIIQLRESFSAITLDEDTLRESAVRIAKANADVLRAQSAVEGGRGGARAQQALAGARTELSTAFDEIFENLGRTAETIAIPAQTAVDLIDARIAALRTQLEQLNQTADAGEGGPSREDIERRIAEAQRIREARGELTEFNSTLESEIRLRARVLEVGEAQSRVEQRVLEANALLNATGQTNLILRAKQIGVILAQTTALELLTQAGKDATEASKDSGTAGKDLVAALEAELKILKAVGEERQVLQVLSQASSDITEDEVVAIRGLVAELNELERAQEGASNAGTAFTGVFDQIRRGAGDLREGLRSIFDDILNNVFKKLITGLLSNLGTNAAGGSNFFGSLLGGLFGSGATPSAQGNLFGPGGLRTFAQGGFSNGTIVDSPTFFNTGFGGTGVAGEAGEELAIAPLVRTSTGRVGIEQVGKAGGGATNVFMTVVTQDANSFNRAGSQIERDLRSTVRRGVS